VGVVLLQFLVGRFCKVFCSGFSVSSASLAGVCCYRLKLGWVFPGFARLCLPLLPLFVQKSEAIRWIGSIILVLGKLMY